MPNVAPQRLQSLAAVPELAQALRAQDKHNLDVAQALNSALVRGDTLLVLTPYTATAPLAVPTDLQAVTFINSWTNFGAGFEVAYYWKDAAGLVHLQGLIKSGTIGAACFTLAAGYRPTATSLFAAVSNSAIGRVDVQSDGQVIPQTGSNVWVSLEGMTFREASSAPYVPPCFPFDVAWPQPYPPSLVLAQCADATNAASPANLALMLPDWVTLTRSGQTLIRVRNLPGLVPSTNYAVTLVAL